MTKWHKMIWSSSKNQRLSRDDQITPKTMAGKALSFIQFNSASLIKSCFFLIKTQEVWGSFYKLHSLTMIKVFLFFLQSETGSKFSTLQWFCNVYILGLFLTFFLSLSVDSSFFFFFFRTVLEILMATAGVVQNMFDWVLKLTHIMKSLCENVVPAKPDESVLCAPPAHTQTHTLKK